MLQENLGAVADHTHTADRRTHGFQAQGGPSGQPDRSSPIQHPDRHPGYLCKIWHRHRGVCPSRTRNENEAPQDPEPIPSLWLHASSVACQVRPPPPQMEQSWCTSRSSNALPCCNRRLTKTSRWSLQHRLITLPKSTKKERLRENADVAGFTIDEKHMKELDALDERLVTDWYVMCQRRL